MRSLRVFPVLIVAMALALAACGDDATSPNQGPSSVQFLDHVDYGCVASKGGALDCYAGATLTRTEAVGDTVVLWINFEANCCPEFTEEVAYEAGELSISVIDTLYACRCICPFENSFRFLCEGAGPVHILFESRATRGGDLCVSGLDTTIVLP